MAFSNTLLQQKSVLNAHDSKMFSFLGLNKSIVFLEIAFVPLKNGDDSADSIKKYKKFRFFLIPGILLKSLFMLFW